MIHKLQISIGSRGSYRIKLIGLLSLHRITIWKVTVLPPEQYSLSVHFLIWFFLLMLSHCSYSPSSSFPFCTDNHTQTYCMQLEGDIKSDNKYSKQSIYDTNKHSQSTSKPFFHLNLAVLQGKLFSIYIKQTFFWSHVWNFKHSQPFLLLLFCFQIHVASYITKQRQK